MRVLKPALRSVTATVLAAMARVVTGVRPIWSGTSPSRGRRIYFANHASHADFVLLSACLPPAERQRTRAIAAADYWGKTRLRRLISVDLLGAVLVERNWVERKSDPLEAMLEVLDSGQSLIFFPEGTRNMTDEPLLRFRSGLYNLAVARPDVELVPCWLENMSRVLPKGEFLPVPLLCRVIFGAPLAPHPEEDRRAFLDRARSALLALDPRQSRAFA
ncbi:MAG: lysophospholipid acyltransferase family protein [Mesorhizobium sp.]|nr:lysophospholipid acyltransferase family protein [Mesorhizobium sp.]